MTEAGGIWGAAVEPRSLVRVSLRPVGKLTWFRLQGGSGL